MERAGRTGAGMELDRSIQPRGRRDAGLTPRRDQGKLSHYEGPAPAVAFSLQQGEGTA
jgi:hypothetical protein